MIYFSADNMKKNDLFFLVGIFVISFVIVGYASLNKNKLVNSSGVDVSFKPLNLVKEKSLLGGVGLEFGHKGRVWLNTLSGDSLVYTGGGEIVKTKNKNGELVNLDVKVPGSATGLVFSDENDFSGDAFVFVTLEGKIFGWQKEKSGLEPLAATLRIDNSKVDSSYTGATSAKTEKGWILYVADNTNNKVEMYDENYKKINSEKVFKDKYLPAGFSVFNLKEILGKIYVTYTNKNNSSGIINVFEKDGSFIKRLATGGELKGPWGLAYTDNTFGQVTGNLLVGNFGNGEINIYSATEGKFLGTAKDENGNNLKIPGLKALTFGTNNGAGTVNELFFSASDPAGFSIFGKLHLMMNQNNNLNPKVVEDPESNTENLDEKFITKNGRDLSYADFIKNLNKNCFKNCLEEKVNTKKQELYFIYNKIFADSKIVIEEYKTQKVGADRVDKINIFLEDLKKQSPEKWLEYNSNICKLGGGNFYDGKKLLEMQNSCLLYNLENWLKQLYVFRSAYVRVELGPLGFIQNIKTKEFKDLIDQEEDRINKSY
jgi:uncharacterized protein (TIGR03118 family)